MKDNRKKPLFTAVAGALIQRGLFVFALQENGKNPVIEDFPNRATNDEAQLAKWGANGPHRNVGVSTTDSFFGPLVVVDIDDKDDRKRIHGRDVL